MIYASDEITYKIEGERRGYLCLAFYIGRKIKAPARHSANGDG
jgi:hypothetical protein